MASAACLICGTVGVPEPRLRVRATDTAGEFDLVACRACGVLRTLPIPESLAPYYATDLAATMHRSGGVFAWMQSVLVAREIRRLGRLETLGTVLDVGCGSGVFTRGLERRGIPVIAIDAAPQRPPTLVDLPAVAYRMMDFDRGTIADLPPGNYTAVLRHVLEHVRDPAALLGALRLHGMRRLYVVVPNAAALEGRLFGSCWFLWDPPRHLWHFDATALQRLCARLQLDVVASGHDTIPNIVPSAYRWLRLRGWPASIYERFNPKGTLAAVSAPLNWLIPGNVAWIVAQYPVRESSRV